MKTPTEQQQIILNHDGNAVVIASPGSGKTFVISQKVKQNLKSILEHQGIIAISYTNKASNELKSRCLSNGENPMSSFFGTIDKFTLAEIIIPFGKHFFGLPINEIKVKTIDSLSEEEQIEVESFNRNLTLNELDHSHINIFKKYFQTGIILIETIGVFADFIFTNSPACQNYIKSRYKYIYIDEYQDSGFEQNQLFIKICKLGIKAIAVGDLNQSIFSFSGKDAKYLEELTLNNDFKLFKLDKNHRCHPSIINYSNFLLNKHTQLIETENKLVFLINVTGDEKSIAEWIDQKIETIQTSLKIERRNKIAILVRGNRTGQIVSNNLKTPYKLFVSNDLDINLNVWSGIFSGLLNFIFNKEFRFIEVIEIFTVYEKFSRTTKRRLAVLKKNIENIEEPINQEYLLSQFIEIAEIIAPNSKSNESIELLKLVLNSEINLRSYIPANEDQINILTLHKSKGLEYDIVIHLDLYEWVFPSKRPGPNNDWNNPEYNDWKQDLNLHYVGITRAKNACFLVTSTQRTNNDGLTRNSRNSEFLSINGINKMRYNNL